MRRLRRRVTRSRSNRETASRRVAPAQIHLPHIDRKTLLLGTALASTLLVCGLGAPSPAAAQIVDQRDNSTNQTASITGFPPSAGSLFIITGSSLVLNTDIVIVNGAKIPPGPTGILATINNHDFYQYNYADVNVTAGLDAGLVLSQSNAIGSNIVINNSGSIAASYLGIAAGIGNTAINQYNDTYYVSVSAGLNAAVVLSQSNAIGSNIVINNSGDIDPVVGIAAGIRAETRP